MRPASPCSPGNRRPPCDQPTLQTRQPPPVRHAALPPYRPNRCRTALAVPRKTDGCSTFTALPPPPQPKGIEGHPEESAVGRGCRGQGPRKGGAQSEGPQPYPAGLRVAGSSAGKPASDRTLPEGPAVGRGRGGEGRNRKAHSRIRQGCEWQGPLPESLRVTGHSRKGPQLAGVAEGRGTIGRPAAVSGRDPQGVRQSFSQALYLLQA